MTAYGRRKRRGSTIHPSDDEPSKSQERFLAQEDLRKGQDEMFERVMKNMVRHDGEPICQKDCGIPPVSI